jgi:hypothetical protein
MSHDPKQVKPSNMRQIKLLTGYLSSLSNGRVVLWCYLIWYLNTVAHHFDPAPAIWLNSLGISALIGVALILSVGGISSARRDKRQTLRLFAMPFCVSSFSSLIKGKGFFLVLPPEPSELISNVICCLAFVATVICLRKKRQVTSCTGTTCASNKI